MNIALRLVLIITGTCSERPRYSFGLDKMYYLVLAILAKVRHLKYHLYCKVRNETKTFLMFKHLRS